MFLAFFPEQMCSDLRWEIWSLLSLNWQVLKVLIVKFQASTLDQCHHLLINLSCKTASKPLNAVSARSAVCFLQPILQLSKRSSRPPLRLCLLYCIYTLLMYTNTARSTEAEQRLYSEVLTSEIRLLQNVCAYKKWSRCYVIFQRLIHYGGKKILSPRPKVVGTCPPLKIGPCFDVFYLFCVILNIV